ncbi:MAG: FKBP-type peptidyl-prolyl cis-trans isomerase [Bacteroidetes bacterium]|nr:FKBP-type peptidyl-prolyl cis-trans isomerase [Bacteroidota bacterium]
MNKLKISGLIAVLAFSLTSCLNKFVETDLDALYQEESTKILQYGLDNGITLTKDDKSGIYYRVLKTNATGLLPSSAYEFHIAYSLKTLNGTLIGQKEAKDSVIVNYYLSNVFPGLIYSLFLLKEGEKGQFFIPSQLAYAENPPSGVAKNEIIVAEIEVLDLMTEDERIESYIKKKNLKVSYKSDQGLRVIKLSENPTADTVKTGDLVQIKYKGMFLSEVAFDNGNTPFSFSIGSNSSIAGFEAGIVKLRKGEKAKLLIPSALGYGSKGTTGIPPYSPLLFDVELQKINGN